MGLIFRNLNTSVISQWGAGQLPLPLIWLRMMILPTTRRWQQCSEWCPYRFRVIFNKQYSTMAFTPTLPSVKQRMVHLTTCSWPIFSPLEYTLSSVFWSCCSGKLTMCSYFTYIKGKNKTKHHSNSNKTPPCQWLAVIIPWACFCESLFPGLEFQ